MSDGESPPGGRGYTPPAAPPAPARRSLLDDLARPHDDNPIAQQPHDLQVMRHEKIAHSQRSLRSSSRLSTTACTETSSAAVGSSRMTRSGWSAIARAMPTRAFCPPESWCGKRSSSSSGRPTLRASSSQRRASRARPLDLAEAQDRIGDRARGGEARIEAVGRVLEHHLDALAHRQLGELLGRDGADILAVEHDRRRRSCRCSRITMVEVVDLPQPDSPTRPTLSPRLTAKLMPSTARNGFWLRRRLAPESFASVPPHALARIFLDELLDDQQRRAGHLGRDRWPGGWGLGRLGIVLGQEIAQRDAGARRRPHQLAGIGMRRRREDRGATARSRPRDPSPSPRRGRNRWRPGRDRG